MGIQRFLDTSGIQTARDEILRVIEADRGCANQKVQTLDDKITGWVPEWQSMHLKLVELEKLFKNFENEWLQGKETWGSRLSALEARPPLGWCEIGWWRGNWRSLGIGFCRWRPASIPPPKTRGTSGTSPDPFALSCGGVRPYY